MTTNTTTWHGFQVWIHIIDSILNAIKMCFLYQLIAAVQLNSARFMHESLPIHKKIINFNSMLAILREKYFYCEQVCDVKSYCLTFFFLHHLTINFTYLCRELLTYSN